MTNEVEERLNGIIEKIDEVIVNYNIGDTGLRDIYEELGGMIGTVVEYDDDGKQIEFDDEGIDDDVRLETITDKVDTIISCYNLSDVPEMTEIYDELCDITGRTVFQDDDDDEGDL